MKPETHDQLANLAKFIVSHYVKYPQDLIVSVSDYRTDKILITLKGNAADQRKMIGTGAKHVTALQNIIAAAGAKLNTPAGLSILESWKGQEEPPSEFIRDVNWSKEKEIQLLDVFRQVCAQIFVTPHRVKFKTEGPKTKLSVIIDQMDPVIESSLSSLFRAIGKTRGRDVTIHAEASKSHAPVPAATPAGAEVP